MKYFFILGNNPALSIAEILAVLPNFNSYELINKDVFVLDIDENISGDIIKRLGGTIKFGRIELESSEKDLLGSMLSMIELEEIKGKFNFGISVYGGKIKTEPLGMEIKKYIKEADKSARYVISREPVLSSVVVETNKLVDGGIEFVLFDKSPLPLIPPTPFVKGESLKGTDNDTPLTRGARGVMIARTLSVQPFKELSFRDYGRPGRDDRSGMLPPKLAQILINLASAPLTRGDGGVLLDPFCGSGTILTEAMLMGFENLIGTDISDRAIRDTKENIKWLKAKFQILNSKFQMFSLSATELNKKIEANSIEAIATEPYLGPQRGQVDLKRVVRELEELYTMALLEMYKVLKPGGRVAMVWPVFKVASRKQLGVSQCLSPSIGNFKRVEILPDDLKENMIIKLSERGTIVYGREGQKVWREIVVLEK